jgi:outer membrane protein TolC
MKIGRSLGLVFTVLSLAPAARAQTAPTQAQPARAQPTQAQAQPAAAPSDASAARRPSPSGAPAATTLTLSTVVQRARENAPAVLVAIERARAASAQADLARAGYLPTVTLSGGTSFALSNGTQVIGGTIATNNTNYSLNFDASASLRWTIWDFGRTAGSVDNAEASERASVLDAEATRRTAVSAAVGAYYAVVLDRDAIENARATERVRARALEVARGYTEAGARPDIERTRAEVSLASARLDVANAEVQFRADLAALAGALGIDATGELDAQAPSPLSLDEDGVLAAQRAATDRPDVLASRLRTQQADLQVDNARRGFLPTLSASASAGIRYTANWRYVDPMWSDTRGPSESVNAGVTLSWAAFDPTVRANVRIAEANAAVARAQEQQSIIAARTEAVQAVVAARAARQALEQSETLARGAAANLGQAQGRYEQGIGTMLELVDAQAADAQARASLVRARWQWEVAKARAWIAQGRVESLR